MKKTRRELGLPHWSPKQRKRLQECIANGDTIAYWNSDAHGRPANGGTCDDGWHARPGLIQRLGRTEATLCGPGALHATHEPHRWAGCRVWVVALRGSVVSVTGKLGATEREILGEVLPEEAWSPSVGVRIGRKDLRGANLRGANLYGANLIGANLRGADLGYANLRSANLYSADLRGADLRGADLGYANLGYAYLGGADLRSANLYSANLYSANLYSANLEGANLGNAYLGNAYLGDWERGPNGYARRKI